VNGLCQAAGVSRAGYYRFLRRPQGKEADMDLRSHISAAQMETILRLGSPHFPRHHGDPEDYVRRTLARAALPAPRTVCSTHAAAPLLPRDETDNDCSNSSGGR
jgi:hypothetical protein